MAPPPKPAIIRVSPKCWYACKALIELAGSYPDGLVATATIAANQGIPDRFATHVLHDLKAGGLVESEKGQHGGFRLMKPPGSIRFVQIVRAVCDVAASASWQGKDAGTGPDSDTRLNAIFLRQWRGATEQFVGALGDLTLQDIIDELGAP